MALKTVYIIYTIIIVYNIHNTKIKTLIGTLNGRRKSNNIITSVYIVVNYVKNTTVSLMETKNVHKV